VRIVAFQHFYTLPSGYLGDEMSIIALQPDL
jgi:hypothetical protein